MTATSHDARDSRRLAEALRLVVRRYARQIRSRPAVTLPALLLPGIGNVLVFYAPPLVIARLLGAFARNDRLSATQLAPYVLTFSGLWLAGEVLWRIAIAFMSRAEIHGMEALYIEAMDELLAKDLSFFHDNYAGSLTKRALGYARRFEDVFDVMSFQVVANALPLLFVGVVLWRYSPLLIVSLAAMLSLTFTMVFPFIRRRQRLVDIREESSNRLAGHVADSIGNAETVRAFAREPEEARIHAQNVGDYGAKTLRSWDYQNLRVDLVTSPMYVLTNTLGLVVALATSRGTGASLETVFITFSYFAAITRVMWEFNHIYRTLEGALTDAAQFAELLLDPPSVVDPVESQPFAPGDFAVELRNVSFRYSPAQPLLFENFSLRIETDSRVGLVGRSGGGKTTLTRLLLRFVDVERGEILVGGQPIDRVPQASLRRAIGYVPQDPSMFHRTIADNIRVGRPGATDAEVRRAAGLAHAAEFIEALPGGYQTLVGERGIKLSGGQRQRVAIARAILKDAPILILDEATSSLDSESEGLIQEALWTLMARRTAIVIAHRLSTVKRMDRLVVLERGGIIEEGSHDALLTRGGLYASLWAHQSGGFLATSEVEDVTVF
ncbi:MAG TPA: ABC transporter ATP-binding protein [Vicinamibacterales bacterium]|jgi:ATP-binding cassette subfamily B protein|nr:ABC transporter ATP-binding protein [Vicinamibacterales bacterium]